MHYVIGVGGVGSRLINELVRLVNKEEIILIDGDKLEEKNFDRQLFDNGVGKFKSEVLGKKNGVRYITEYFSDSSDLTYSAEDWIWCCVDNHAGRRNALSIVDQHHCKIILGANEYTDAEAYYYENSMRGSVNDPRVLYPNILVNNDDDPLRPTGCTGTAALVDPQLGLSNNMASTLMLHLFWFHTMQKQVMNKEETRHLWPIHHMCSVYKVTTVKWGERKKIAIDNTLEKMELVNANLREALI